MSVAAVRLTLAPFAAYQVDAGRARHPLLAATTIGARSVESYHPCKEATMNSSGEVNTTEQLRDVESLLFNPHTYDPSHFDDATRRMLRATIDWFERRGKETLLKSYRECVWYADFLEFVAKERLFAKMGTPAREANGDHDKRWDTSRISAFSEVLAFYGLDYWYAWQVTILGLGPIWQSDNALARSQAAQWLDDGAVFAFGLSEREHGADIYTTDMVLTPDGGGGFRATGGKYYIGNANVARMVSVFGRRSDAAWPGRVCVLRGGQPARELPADEEHRPGADVRGRVPSGELPGSRAGCAAHWAIRLRCCAELGERRQVQHRAASIGMCEHAMYEAVTHAHNRILYGNRVTDFPHVRRSFVDAYARLIAMKSFGDRAIDYFRSASPQDRRYLLFNPVSKMKITTEGEKVIALLWDVIAAKGFERDTYFRSAGKDIGALPKLEGTVHVNLALILKFLPNYLFAPTEQPPVPTRQDAVDDEFLFRQGPARGLGKVTFADLATGLRAVRRPAQRRTVPGAGGGLHDLAAERCAGRRATAGPGFPAGARTAVHADRLRAADPRAGQTDRARP